MKIYANLWKSTKIYEIYENLWNLWKSMKIMWNCEFTCFPCFLTFSMLCSSCFHIHIHSICMYTSMLCPYFGTGWHRIIHLQYGTSGPHPIPGPCVDARDRMDLPAGQSLNGSPSRFPCIHIHISMLCPYVHVALPEEHLTLPLDLLRIH